MAEEIKGIMVYGNMETPEEAEQRRYDVEHGIVRFHPTTYLECEIPVAIENKLAKMIKKEVEKFERKCKCEYCKENRKK